jgi:GT2 family glycosyltransferase
MPESYTHTISILIKTFNRKESLIRLLTSIEKQHSTLAVLIADDSEHPYQEEILHLFPSLSISYYCLPFDSGLSAGRNFLLTKTTTPYFLLCDDDFQLPVNFGLEKTLSVLTTYDLDIAGGRFDNYIIPNSFRKIVKLLLTPTAALRFIQKKPLPAVYVGYFKIQDGTCELHITNQVDERKDYIPCDCVNNFFLAKTNKITDLGGWDDQLKLGEHEDFFYRALLKGLKTAFIPGFSVNHYPQYKGNYIAFRQRAQEYKKIFLTKFNFHTYTEKNTDSNKIIFQHTLD